jgi:hypothetical protein
MVTILAGRLSSSFTSATLYFLSKVRPYWINGFSMKKWLSDATTTIAANLIGNAESERRKGRLCGPRKSCCQIYMLYEIRPIKSMTGLASKSLESREFAATELQTSSVMIAA